MRYLGAHVSIAGGFAKCIDRIDQLGGNCLMTFASSPRSLQFKKQPDSEITKYLQKKQAKKIGPHFFHGVYLINLAAASHGLLQASINSLIAYQQFAYQIGALGTIFHLGSHQGRGLRETIDQVVASLNFVMDSSPKGTRLILENAAGHQGTIGATFEELGEIIKRLGDKSKVGVCLDTQHSFASGYPLDKALDRFDKAIGLKYLHVIHFNDSKTDFSSHVDRHANLGEGKIGLDTLKSLASHPRLKEIPFILEVPGAGEGPRKKDLDILKTLIQ